MSRDIPKAHFVPDDMGAADRRAAINEAARKGLLGLRDLKMGEGGPWLDSEWSKLSRRLQKPGGFRVRHSWTNGTIFG